MPLMIIFLAYQILWCFALPFFVIVMLYRHFIMHKQSDIKQRVGWIPQPPHQKKVIWLHAVSVGEVLSLEHVIKRIKETIPNACCYVTTGTEGGKKMALSRLNADYVSYLPFDFIICTWLAFVRIHPHALIIIEAELWPNLLMLAHIRNVPIYTINARISDRSAPRYHRFSFLLRPLLQCITHFYVQQPADKKKFMALGCKASKIDIMGNIKICNVLDKKELYAPIPQTQQDHLVMLVGSLHPGEAQIYVNVFTRLKETNKHLKLLLVPRHLTWTSQLEAMLKATPFRYTLWTPHDTHSINDLDATMATCDILAIAKLGMLFELYAYADLFFLGGTFVPVGGHNLMEPAIWQLPAIVGPYHHNCTHEVTALREKEGVVVALTEQALYATTIKMVTDHDYRKKIGQHAHQWLVDNSTAVDAVLTNLLQKL
ncbi:MAG: glycosyltransferase N-terminal domain-containing protein [Candidatus Babeliales bacterium]